MDILQPLLIAMLGAGTPILFAALGELVAERSGVMNLGVEGMMLVGAVAAFSTAMMTGSIWVAIVAGALAGAAVSLVFAFVSLTLLANQIATGIALSIAGTGLSGFAGRAYSGLSLPVRSSSSFPLLESIPILGSLHPLVLVSWIMVGLVSWFLFRTRTGLVLRAVGESPENASALGFPVLTVRYLAVLFGGAMAGLAGAYLSVIYTNLWTDGMSSGRGWIAVALVVFATWRPLRTLVGAYLFGGVTVAQYFAQGGGYSLPTEVMSALPYLATIVVLVLISRDRTAIRMNQPASLGKEFKPSA
jgi:simple sugar transport system permease protein